MTTVNTKKSIKTAVVVTYVIATLLLIAGWFVLGFGYNKGLEVGDMMMFWYVPAIINAFLSPYLGKALITGAFVTEHQLPEFTQFNSQVIPGVDINIIALMLLVYLVVTVLAIIFLIPVFAGNKAKKTSLTCAYVIEGAALVALGILFVFSAWETSLKTTATGYLNLICVFAAVLIVLFVQSIVEKKSYGVVKMFLFIFSAAAFMFAMFAIDNMIETVLSAISLDSVWTAVTDGLKVGGGLYAQGGVEVTGFNALHTMIGGLMRGENLIWVSGNSITLNIVNVCVFALFAVLAFNLIVDFVGLMAGNKTNAKGAVIPHKGGKIFGLVRYALALVIAIVIEVCVVVDKSLADGICLYFVIALLLINVIIDIVRLARVPAQKRKAEQQTTEALRIEEEGMTGSEQETTDIISEGSPAFTPAPAYAESQTEVQPVAETTAEEPAAQATEEQLVISDIPEETAEPEEESEPAVYTPKPVVYDGPTDAFLDTLTTAEKIEFCKVFVDKTRGNLPAKMPEYEIGGSNDDFFPAVFINLGRFRAMLSSSLLRKIYKYLNSK